MSTRCMVKVTSQGLAWTEEPVYLYHHTDGYPSNMIPVIKKAFEMGVKQVTEFCARWNGTPDFWQMGRAAKVAGLLCAADPLVFEPDPWASIQDSLKLPPYHADLEYVYSVHVVNKTDPKDRGAIRWIVTTYSIKPGFWDNPTQDLLQQVGPKVKLAP